MAALASLVRASQRTGRAALAGPALRAPMQRGFVLRWAAPAAAAPHACRRAFSAAPAEHPLDDFFEPPDESDPENMTRYAGRAWKMEELRNKVRSLCTPQASHIVCACE